MSFEYEAPAKLNLALHVRPPRRDGLHPIESLVQTIEWLDSLEVDEWEGADEVTVVGGPEIEDNLVERAWEIVRRAERMAPLRGLLTKSIPAAAGLGGGSSDAAAALRAAVDAGGVEEATVEMSAPTVGADVPLFLSGGTLLVTGVGETLSIQRPLGGFSVAVAVPEFGLSTADVYRRWGELEGPAGEVLTGRDLPPALRDGIPKRNDLLPAAYDLEPRLGDFMADLRALWGRAVSLTGSGSGCFGYFADLDEAESAANSASTTAAVTRGVSLRPHGVMRLDPVEE